MNAKLLLTEDANFDFKHIFEGLKMISFIELAKNKNVFDIGGSRGFFCLFNKINITGNTYVLKDQRIAVQQCKS